MNKSIIVLFCWLILISSCSVVLSEITTKSDLGTKIYISNDNGLDGDGCGIDVAKQCKTIQYAINIFKNTHTIKRYNRRSDEDDEYVYSYPPLEISMDCGLYDSLGNSDINLFELDITLSSQQQQQQCDVLINNYNTNNTIFTVIKDPSHSQRDSASRFQNENNKNKDHTSQTLIHFKNLKSTYAKSNNHFGSFLYANTFHKELIIRIDIDQCEFNSSVPSHTTTIPESSLIAISGHYDAEAVEPRTFISIRKSKFSNHQGSNYKQLSSAGVLSIRSKANDVDLSVDSSVFSANTGGVISISSCHSFQLANSLISNNSQNNSAVHISNCKRFAIANTVFQSNRAKIGGALSITKSRGDIDSTQFKENTASSLGGAIHLSGQTHLSMRNTLFDGNIASQGGAIMSESRSSLEISQTNFTNNRAIVFGPSLYCSYSTVDIQGHDCIFQDNYHLGKYPKQIYQGVDCMNVLHEEPTCTFKGTNQTTLDEILSNGNCSRGWTNFFFDHFMTIICVSMVLIFALAFFTLASMSEKNLQAHRDHINQNQKTKPMDKKNK
ncbi:hypothetical protein CYY_009169 [Polysphondylium violaceum]|uniref:Right handed beta helix domain-containing protein n=1 Tax=Polysphondylium violaceum TaxID=133409 RepID=A0A8J4UPP6_9MYCE|nr:hypothetical protein CYY_009169 [Polysphondylium violaceum]